MPCPCAGVPVASPLLHDVNNHAKMIPGGVVVFATGAGADVVVFAGGAGAGVVVFAGGAGAGVVVFAGGAGGAVVVVGGAGAGAGVGRAEGFFSTHWLT